jgi:site-specific recombinase XerC
MKLHRCHSANEWTGPEVKHAHLELLARSMEASDRMPATVARRLSTLCGFSRYCHDEGLLVRNPTAHVRPPKVDPESRTLGLDRNELAALLAQAGPRWPRDHALISLLGLNGLEISEVLGAERAARRVCRCAGSRRRPDRQFGALCRGRAQRSQPTTATTTSGSSASPNQSHSLRPQRRGLRPRSSAAWLSEV